MGWDGGMWGGRGGVKHLMPALPPHRAQPIWGGGPPWLGPPSHQPLQGGGGHRPGPGGGRRGGDKQPHMGVPNPPGVPFPWGGGGPNPMGGSQIHGGGPQPFGGGPLNPQIPPPPSSIGGDGGGSHCTGAQGGTPAPFWGPGAVGGGGRGGHRGSKHKMGGGRCEMGWGGGGVPPFWDSLGSFKQHFGGLGPILGGGLRFWGPPP